MLFKNASALKTKLRTTTDAVCDQELSINLKKKYYKF